MDQIQTYTAPETDQIIAEALKVVSNNPTNCNHNLLLDHEEVDGTSHWRCMNCGMEKQYSLGS
jgi:hypothetical protein